MPQRRPHSVPGSVMRRRPSDAASRPTGGLPAATPLLILIGGAGDGTPRKVGQGVDWLRARPDAARREVHYFFHWQKGAVLTLAAAQPPSRPIRLIGHSWGGNAAARVAAALGLRGRAV